jgi:predicted amidophosphoribosyltransferase
MDKAVSLLKYDKVTRPGRQFAARREEAIRSELKLFVAAVVVPVPFDPARRRERGSHQAELIARPLARNLGFRLRAYLLVRGQGLALQGCSYRAGSAGNLSVALTKCAGARKLTTFASC